MTKFTTVISEKDGRQKQIKVWIEDSTAELLLKLGDEEFIHEYILEEYKARNIAQYDVETEMWTILIFHWLLKKV